MNLPDHTGHKIPFVSFRMWENNHWVTKTTAELFKNKRIILFALPGAFTPVCSSLHLPGYNELYATFRALGIDDMFCLSVNDSFVLNEWKKAEKADHITMLPDVEGEFSKKLGMMSNASDMCLGNRSWRYSMVVYDGIIEKMFIEPDGSMETYGESSAEKMLNYLDPDAELPKSVALFSKSNCPVCTEIKTVLKSLDVVFEEHLLNQDFSLKTVKALVGAADLPVVFIDGKRFQDIDDMTLFLRSPKLR